MCDNETDCPYERMRDLSLCHGSPDDASDGDDSGNDKQIPHHRKEDG